MSLSRPLNPMPPDVAQRLRQTRLTKKFEDRPPYQCNDYLGWINRAKRDETRQKRIAQMLNELRQGGVYMNMAWSDRSKSPSGRPIRNPPVSSQDRKAGP